MSRRQYRPIGNKYSPGDYYIKCDRSGFKVRRSEAKRTWDNLIVRDDMWEARQPQDFVRGHADEIAVEEARSGWETNDTFLTTNEVTADDL